MSERVVFAAGLLLVLVSGGSAALSETYSTVTGTADIDPAVSIESVQNDSDRDYVEIKNNAPVSIDGDRISVSTGSNTVELESKTLKPGDSPELNAESGDLSDVLVDGDSLVGRFSVQIDGNEILEHEVVSSG
jgi:hypothetical protein